MPWSDIDVIIMRKEDGKQEGGGKVKTDVLAQLENKLRVANREISNLRNRQVCSQRYISFRVLQYLFSKL